MAIALPILFQLFEPVQAAVQWLSGASASNGSRRSSSTSRAGAGTAVPGACPASAEPRAGRVARPRKPVAALRAPARAWQGPSRLDSSGRPLRVLRVVEGRDAMTAGAGRMVISGRMADVCAELDRLASLETRH